MGRVCEHATQGPCSPLPKTETKPFPPWAGHLCYICMQQVCTGPNARHQSQDISTLFVCVKVLQHICFHEITFASFRTREVVQIKLLDTLSKAVELAVYTAINCGGPGQRYFPSLVAAGNTPLPWVGLSTGPCSLLDHLRHSGPLGQGACEAI